MTATRRIKEIVFFALGSFFLLLGLSWLLDNGVRHSEDEGFKKVNSILMKHIDPDIISFGSSVGEKSFNSKIISERTASVAYNCCIDGTNFEQYKGLIEAYNNYSSHKSTVLLFEAYFSFQKLAAISSIERYAAYLDDPFVYAALYNIDSGVTFKSRYIPLYKNTVLDHTYYKAAFDGWRGLLFQRHKQDTLQGFAPKYMIWQKDEDAAMDAMKPFSIMIEQKVVADYIKIINELQSKGKKVIIVLPPVYKRLYKEKTNYEKLESTLDSISRRAGCRLLNFSRCPMSLEKRFFYNTNHLNAEGAGKFSKMLADSLPETR